MKNIAIIPARSGSKGLPNKNVKELCGKPLMAYTIEAALRSNCFDEVMVSTDSEVYAEIARKNGASVPFIRSETTSTDNASSWDTVEEVLSEYEKRGYLFDSFCLLQPTSPLRTAEDICAAYDIFNKKASFAVVSVCEAEHSPLWCGLLGEDNELNCFIDRNSMKQRQAGGKYYRLNGAIYIVTTELFRKDRFLYQKGSYAYIMDTRKSIDIDTIHDFEYAEFLIQKKKSI